ncbi:DMT family transporter [Limosilactobacillus fermentum]|uniref:DMT family transporter n=1 Tax=Limosilactobacillus fermentum TaxID=1613 RepID=UPI0039823A74
MFIKWEEEEEKVGYALLSLAIGFEILGTNLLKLSVGFTRVGIGITSLACYGVSFYLMALSYQKLPPKRSGVNLGGAWNYSGDVTGVIRVPRTGGPSSVVRRLLDNSGGPFSKL